jgi:3',5'-cyclic AMP phosphodiesterase CpdA
MRLAWLTDVHANFLDPPVAGWADEVVASGVDAVLLGGDIAEAPSLVDTLRELAVRVDRPIYFVLGNHDYYHGEIAEVRRQVAALAAEVEHLHYLPTCGAVELTPTAGLVGVGGWGDGRLGSFASSRVVLNDNHLIRDLRLPPAALARRLAELGDGEAAALRAALAPAAHRFDQLLVLTHVPPFREACWYDGVISNDQWLPHFTCHAVGEVLRAVATARPTCRIRVLCGHTHGAGRAQILPNLEVTTGAAAYGQASIQEIVQLA